MNTLKLFTDGSVNPKSNIGFGAYLIVPEEKRSLEALKKQVKIIKFENTSSTKLELQTLLWTLKIIQALGSKVIIYTDSQNIIGLQKRRKKLELNDYRSRKNTRLRNHELYQEFYRLTDELDCEFIKVKGHKQTKQKNHIDQLFSLVDKASRHALRKNKLE